MTNVNIPISFFFNSIITYEFPALKLQKIIQKTKGDRKCSE